MTDVQKLRALLAAAGKVWDDVAVAGVPSTYWAVSNARASYETAMADAALIAGAVNALPELLDEVERLEHVCADLIAVAQGCADYGGGHSGACYDAFQDGIGTVVNVLKNRLAGVSDYQMRVLKAIGSESEMLDRLRDAETERDALRAEVERLRARVAEMCAAAPV